ncbi:GNAT family N-acetyltransferase [Haladaptatus sp. ZSTT2]|uniref:GNAT family N-acetyltransferase n=1 Tax=Haladaptatus sp. ZSTT2 TaxID=3120515 RepID=UPI00300F32E1
MVGLHPLVADTSDFEAAIALYCHIFSNDETAVRDRFERHTTYPGYRGFLAVDGDEVIGYVYGYTSKPGQYYHEALRAAMPKDVSETWLTDCFEFVELGVSRPARRQGIGRLLHDTLLRDLPHETSVLTTHVGNVAARRMYENLGWEVIHRPFVLDGGNEMVVMGKRLRD